MESLLIPTLSLSRSLSTTTPTRASFKPLHVPTSPAIRFAGDRKSGRGLSVVTRAGASTSSYVFALALPLSLLAVTIFTSFKIADKLDRDYFEELIIDQAIREAEEEDDEEEDDDDGDDSPLEEKAQQRPALGDDIPLEEKVQQPALPRTRNRPKREA